MHICVQPGEVKWFVSVSAATAFIEDQLVACSEHIDELPEGQKERKKVASRRKVTGNFWGGPAAQVPLLFTELEACIWGRENRTDQRPRREATAAEALLLLFE